MFQLLSGPKGLSIAISCIAAVLIAEADGFAEGQPVEQVAERADRSYGKLEDVLSSASSPVANVHEWERKRDAIHDEIMMYLGQFPSERCALKTRVLREEKCAGYVRKKVRYLTQPGEDVTAFLLVPDSATTGSAPAILAMHQTTEAGKEEVCGMTGRPSMHYGLDMVLRGYVVLAPDSITAGERIYPGYEPFETAAFDEINPHWSAMGKMLWDHQRGLDYLETVAEVDKDRVGALGHSLGAYNAIFLAAFDPRIKAVAESCGYATIASDAGRERWSRTSWFVHFPRLRPFVEPGSSEKSPFDFNEVLALIAPRPVFQSAGLRDQIFQSCASVAQVHMQLKRLYGFLGKPECLETFLVDGAHDFSPEAKVRAYDFLDKHLKAEHLSE